MARNRMIKPEFWEDDKIAECSTNARLLFIATWNFADDEGFLEYRPKWLKAKCFPYDNVDVVKLVNELLKVGRLELHGEILWVKNFLKHQRIDRPKASELSQLFNNSTNARRTLDDESTTKEKLKEVKLREEKEKEVSSKEDRQEPKEFGDPRINELLEFIKKTFGLRDFKESQLWQRRFGKNLVALYDKMGKELFRAALVELAKDGFKSKNCNSLNYVYGQIKSTKVEPGYIEPEEKVINPIGYC